MEYCTREIKELKNSKTKFEKGISSEKGNMWQCLGLNRMWSETRKSGERF
jgi:hypothetical protein